MMPLVVLEGYGDTRLNQLAERLGLTPSTALRMVDRLIMARLVTVKETRQTGGRSSSA
jgi:DNA-binding MarR family transcriptional regulator